MDKYWGCYILIGSYPWLLRPCIKGKTIKKNILLPTPLDSPEQSSSSSLQPVPLKESVVPPDPPEPCKKITNLTTISSPYKGGDKLA